jgi:hypothetical protein
MSVSTKSKTFEFWSISLWEGIIVFIIFIILFHLPMFYTSELQKWWGIVIRLYLPMVVLCTFGYIKLRSRKLIIEVNKKNQREFIYTRNNKQLLTEFEKVKIFYLKSLKGKIGRMLRIDGTIYFIYSKNPFSKEVAKQYKLKIEELQKMIGNNAKKERIDSVPLTISLLMDVIPFIIILLALIFFIALFTDNLHWFDF